MTDTEFSGALRERVVVERRVDGVDMAGSIIDRWETVATRWARVTPMMRSEGSRLSAETRLTARSWKIEMRRLQGIALDMRVRWRGLTLGLSGVILDPASADRIVLLADELGG